MKRMTAAVATALLGLSANGAQAVDPVFVGSDTLESFMISLLPHLPAGIASYSPLGSGPGENAIDAEQQELAPMSRFLTQTGTTHGCNGPTVDLTRAGCWEVAQDSITLVGSDAQACTGLIVSAGTNGWRTVLRQIYAGQPGTGTADNVADAIAVRCNNPTRQLLVNTWSNIFQGGCGSTGCPNGLKHAFRRDDVSGTTAVFLTFLGLPAIGTTPFCNGLEDEDRDPIRRTCDGDGAVGIPGAQNGDTLCGVGATSTARNADGSIGLRIGDNTTLGLVVTTLIPPTTFNETHAGRNCSAIGSGINPTSGGGSFGLVPWTSQDLVKYGQNCPNGAGRVFGQCNWPKPPSSVTPSEFGCIANKNSRPLDTPAGSKFDGRLYNLWAKNADGTTKQYLRGTTTKFANLVGSKYRQQTCRQNDETNQIGCFVANDACSIGFAGYRATVDWAPTKALQLDTQDPTPDGINVNATYPMARPLYLCQKDGFGSSVGTQSAPFVGAQQAVYNALVAGTIAGSDIDNARTTEYFKPLTAVYTKTCCSGVKVTGATACP